MTKKPNWDKLDVGIEYQGRAITLPADPGEMPTEKAIEALQRKLKDENQEYDILERFDDAYPYDGAVAFSKAMAKLYGWSSPTTDVIMSFFGPQKKPPKLVTVKTGPSIEDVVQVPVGKFNLPGVENDVHTAFHNEEDGKGTVFIVFGRFKKKERHVVLELVSEARRIVREESIYRGKPIALSVQDDGTIHPDHQPTFLDVSDMSIESLIFTPAITNQISVNILAPIRETAACRKHKIPLKRGVLLEGPYGTGKSLTARMVARVAEQHGWTFILLDKVQGLRRALEFANRYAPAVVFAEDIDRIAEKRSDGTNDLINVIDGVVSKRSEIMTVLTTNFVEKLDPVILRPGRLDAVISLRAPDQETVGRLLRFYAGTLISPRADLTQASMELAGQIPASIRECVERAKLGMLDRKDTVLADLDLATAAQTMKNHLALLNKKVAEQSPGEKLADSLRAVVTNGHGEDMTKLLSSVETIHENVERVKRAVS